MAGFMSKLHVEGETFEAFAPLYNISDSVGELVDARNTFKFVEAPDNIGEALKAEEAELWARKAMDAEAKGQQLTNGFQYLLRPDHAESFIDDVVNLRNSRQKISIPVAQGSYSRIELAAAEIKRHPERRDFPNVLALCEIVTDRGGEFMFVERGGEVAYHGGTSQLHALVAGNFPRSLTPRKPENMTVKRWLEEQQKTEHGIEPYEIHPQRTLLGVVLDKTLGYKPDIAFSAVSYDITAKDLEGRFAADAWEKKGVRKFPVDEKKLIEVILEHRDLKRHVPPGLGAAILQLAAIGGTQALRELNYEGKQRGAPLIEFRASK